MSNDKLYTLEFDINNIKSYYGQPPLKLSVSKPITVIAGPNGEGKSNLLEAMLYGIRTYIKHSTKLKSRSSFFKNIILSKSPNIVANFNNMVFTDLVKRGFLRTSTGQLLPERLNPTEMISYDKNRGKILFSVKRYSSKKRVALVSKSAITFIRNEEYQHRIEKNMLNKLDLFYLNTDTGLNDFFVKYVGQEYSKQIAKRRGVNPKGRYHREILSIFKNEGDRLIRDVEDGEFEEVNTRGKFMTSSLPTGAKKESFLYLLGILKEKYKSLDDWIAIFLIDEFESGLHINRQKKIIDALINSYSQDSVLKNHVKIILTTHSPVIYSELSKNTELVDVYYTLRQPNLPSVVVNKYDSLEDKDNRLVEKKILTELGLNIFDLPNKILFVEGPTDKFFFQNIFTDIGIQPFRGGNIPQVISDLLVSLTIARTKDYLILVDKNKIDKINSDVEKIKIENSKPNINILTNNIDFNSIEEFIFDINIERRTAHEMTWNHIQEKIELFNNILTNNSEKLFNFNIENKRSALNSKGMKGIAIFFNDLKKNHKEFYSSVGKYWREMLSESNITFIKDYQKKHHLKYKQ